MVMQECTHELSRSVPLARKKGKETNKTFLSVFKINSCEDVSGYFLNVMKEFGRQLSLFKHFLCVCEKHNGRKKYG